MMLSKQDPEVEVAALRERIRDLETVLGFHDDNLAVAFKLPSSLHKLLALLMSVPSVTPEMIHQRLEIATDAKVAVHRLRTALKEWNVEIHSKRTLGYWIDPKEKARIRGIVDELSRDRSSEEKPTADIVTLVPAQNRERVA